MTSLPHYMFFFVMNRGYVSNFPTLQITDIWNTERAQILMNIGTDLGLGTVCPWQLLFYLYLGWLLEEINDIAVES